MHANTAGDGEYGECFARLLSLSIYPSHRVVGIAPVCTHPQLGFVCFAVGNPANCVNGLSTDGGAVAWYLAHQRCGSTGLLLCFPELFVRVCVCVCAYTMLWVSGYEAMASVTYLPD